MPSDTEKIAYYEAALKHITQRLGRFSRDPLTHAGNTIEDMAKTAEEALAGTWENF